MIVSFGPGGGADIVGRIIAQSMQGKLGQAVVVENRPGAAGTLGNEAVARADKDGYTLGVMTAGQIIAAVMNKSLRYDTLTAFEPISLVARAGLIIVTRPDFPTNDVKELVAAAKARPGQIAFASPGFGATQHFTGELFKQITGVDMLHVPFRTSPEAIAAVLGGQVDVLFDTISAVLGQVSSGQLKVACGHWQGPISSGSTCTGSHRIRCPSRLRRHDLVWPVRSKWHAGHRDRQAQPDRKCNPRRGGHAGAIDQGRSGRTGLQPRGRSGQHMAAEFSRWNAVREKAGIPQQ